MKTLKMITAYTAALVAGIALFSVTASAQASAQATPQLTDPEIASVVLVANQIDVDYGKLCLKKTDNAKIKHFANTMIKDHESIIKATIDLAKKLGVKAKNNTLSKSLIKGQKATMKKLKEAAKDGTFNKAYIDNEVGYHEAVISAVENILIPQSKNKELKSTIKSVLPLLKQHLQMAKDTQANFK